MADVKNHATLPTNLVSYWELEEASGTRVDSTATGNDLTDNNTVTQGTGIQGNCASFAQATNEYLSISDASQTGLDITGDLSVAGWIQFGTVPPSGGVTHSFTSKYGTANNSSWIVQLRNDASQQKIRFYNSDDGTALGSADINWTISTDTWYHFVLTYDASAGQIEVFQDNTSLGTATGTLKTSIYNGTSDFQLGAWSTNYNDGLMDEVGIWDKVLSNSEISDLYNSGSGIPYETPPTDYPLTCAVGAFTLTGIATTLLKALNITLAVGSFTLTSIATVLNRGRKMSADVGSFVLTSIDATLLAGKRLVASAGSFALTGVSTNFKIAISFAMGTGSFALTSIATTLRKGLTMVLDVGSFTLTGIATTLRKGYTLALAVGAFTLTGIATTFTRGIKMTASVGTFTVTSITTIFKGWFKQVKNTTNWTNQDKS